MRVLVVEDDPVIANGLRIGLGLSGTVVDVVTTCADAREAVLFSGFDVIVLDVMLPDGSGLDWLTELRAAGDKTPVLLLTALDEVGDRVTGLDRGADDYLGKPFDLDELAARVRAVARRNEGRASGQLVSGDIALDPASLTAVTKNGAVRLSPREAAILSALMKRTGAIRSKGDLEAVMYGWQEGVESNTVEVHIHNLRMKIGKDTIETVRGAGYRMRDRKP
jgi:DNA-binding response OmpR family regulator